MMLCALRTVWVLEVNPHQSTGSTGHAGLESSGRHTRVTLLRRLDWWCSHRPQRCSHSPGPHI